MPVTYSLDTERRTLHTVCAGVVRLEEVLAHLDEIGRDETLPVGLDLLLDLSESETAPAPDQLRLVAERVAATRAEIEWGRCAIVVSRDLLFGLSRMFEVHSDGSFVASRVFRDRGKALDWLRLGADAG